MTKKDSHSLRPILCNDEIGGNLYNNYSCVKKNHQVQNLFCFVNCERVWKEGEWVSGGDDGSRRSLLYNFALGTSHDAPLPISTFSDPINCMYRIV